MIGHTSRRSPGQIAYEADVRRHPTYHDGKPRKAWEDLAEIVRWSWEKNPQARRWGAPAERRAS